MSDERWHGYKIIKYECVFLCFYLLVSVLCASLPASQHAAISDKGVGKAHAVWLRRLRTSVLRLMLMYLYCVEQVHGTCAVTYDHKTT